LKISPMDLMDYLMDCQDYIKSDDLTGWQTKFDPESLKRCATSLQSVKPKRRRMSPNAVLLEPERKCKNCNATAIIDDVTQGSSVCTACGMIQYSQLFTAEPVPYAAGAGHTLTAERYHVHRYSRVVYFRSFLQSLSGLTTPKITDSELASLRATLVGPVTVEKVQKALIVTKLTRLRRHKYRLAEMCSNGAFKAAQIESDMFLRLLKLFRIVEVYWEERKMKLHCPTRKVFLSYSYLFYQFCHHLGCPQYTGTHHLLKGKKLQQLQHKVYGRIAKKAKLKCDLTVFYTKQ
jgi:hypothetical protein